MLLIQDGTPTWRDLTCLHTDFCSHLNTFLFGTGSGRAQYLRCRGFVGFSRGRIAVHRMIHRIRIPAEPRWIFMLWNRRDPAICPRASLWRHREGLVSISWGLMDACLRISHLVWTNTVEVDKKKLLFSLLSHTVAKIENDTPHLRI